MIKSNKRTKALGEVFTPPELVNEILDKLPSIKGHCLEPACGNGNFVVEVIRRKIASGDSPMFALKSVFAVDLMVDNVLATRYRALEVAGLLDNPMALFVVSRNIRQGNALKMKFTLIEWAQPQWLKAPKIVAEHNKTYVEALDAIHKQCMMFDVKYFKMIGLDDAASALRKTTNPHDVIRQYRQRAQEDWMLTEI